MTTLLKHLQKRFHPAQLNAQALHLGISDLAMQTGLLTAAAMVLEALQHRAASAKTDLMQILSLWPAAGLHVRPGISGEGEKAAEQLLNLLFGTERQARVRILSAHADLPEHAASAILTMGAMAVGAELQDELQVQGDGFWKKLPEWSAEWMPALPLASIRERTSAFEEEAKRRWMLPILLLVVLGIGLWYWAKGCSMERGVHQNLDAAVIDSAGHSIDDAVQKASAEIDDMQDSVRTTH